jgi:hypothetical protein
MVNRRGTRKTADEITKFVVNDADVAAWMKTEDAQKLGLQTIIDDILNGKDRKWREIVGDESVDAIIAVIADGGVR